MIVDANLLVYLADRRSPHHAATVAWWREVVAGPTRVGLPVQSIAAFLRLTSDLRIAPGGSHERSFAIVRSWLALPRVWVPPVGAATLEAYASVCASAHVSGRLVPDALLAAVALEHGVPVASADADFARFAQVHWVNPLDGAPGA